MQKYYRFLHCDKNVRKESSSGGAFTAISDIFINNGVIYGCILDEHLKAVHIRAANRDDRDRMRGSKYIQSDIYHVLSHVKKDLSEHQKVLFTGTPCQIAAVKQYIQIMNIDSTELVLMEVICHGVGSRRFFQDYLKFLEQKYHGKAVKCKFRAKHCKGQKQDMEVCFDNGKTYNASSTKYDWFYSVYLKNLILRPSCYECQFAKKDRVGDLSIADHWGFRDDDSYSLIVSNTDKGENLLHSISEDSFEQISKSEVRQPHMDHPSAKPDTRDIFWKLYLEQGYPVVQQWVGNNTWKGRLIGILTSAIQKLHLAGAVKGLAGCHGKIRNSNNNVPGGKL